MLKTKTKDIESQIHEGKHLPLMEIFHTIQGEGCHTGKSACFIRLAGCDVGCIWCDVKSSWDASEHPVWKVSDIVNEAKKYPAKIAVITGGEPLMYNIDLLINELKKSGFSIHIETSGSHPLSGKPDWICLSPKKFKQPLKEIYSLADELKVIVYNKSDFDWAVSEASKVTKKCHLLLQPEWDKREKVLPWIIDFVLLHPEWQISLQTHKYLGMP